MILRTQPLVSPLGTALLLVAIQFAQADLPDASDSRPNGQGGRLLFADDFSSGDTRSESDYFFWTRRIRLQVAEIDGVHAVRFRYQGINDGGSGDSAHWSELGFRLRNSSEDRVTDRNHITNVNYPEVWIRYRLKVPANYTHRMRGGSPSGDNLKGLVYLWRNNYEGQGTGTYMPLGAGIAGWPTAEGHTRTTLAIGRSRPGGHNNPNGGTDNYMIHPANYGQWVDFIIGMKASSGPQANDGFVRVYRDGRLAQAWENQNMWPGDDNPAHAGFDKGYILGYHNSGFEETTDFYLTDFRIGTSRESVADAEPAGMD